MKKFFLASLLLALLFLPVDAFAKVLPIQEVTSPRGIKAWLVYDNKLPVIAMRFAFRGGVEQDPVDKQGLATLTTALLTQGAGPYDAEAFQQKLADESIQLDISAGRDSLTGAVKTLRSSRATAFSLLHLALTKPRFDTEAIERARSQQLTALRFQLGKPEWQARQALFAAIYKGHPYSMRRLGTTKTLASLTREDIKDFAARHLARDNLLIAVTGDITPEELAKELDRIFGNLPARAKLTPVMEAAWPEKTALLLIPRDGTQTDMLFTRPVLKRADPDWYAAEIANYILGAGGFSSRLMHVVRDKEGLTYGISTGLAAMDSASMLVGNAATDNAKAGKAWELVQKVWNDFYTKGATENEIIAAKDFLTGSLPLSMTSTDAIASVLLGIQLDRLGIDYLDRRNALIRQVSMDDVNRVIRRWFDPASLTLSMAGEPEGLTPTMTLEAAKE